MTETVDYAADAELYASGTARLTGNLRYMRFSSLAEAVRYAVERVPGAKLPTLVLEAADTRYAGKAIRALYDAPAYPLSRAKVPT